MAERDLPGLLVVPGRVAINPTDLTAAFPHGGTELGVVMSVRAERTVGRVRITAEEFGVEVVEVIEAGEVFAVTMAFRSWDNDMISTLFGNTVLGTTTGKRKIVHPGSATTSPRAGARLSTRSVGLVFSPDDTENHPAIMLYRALPETAEKLEIDLALKKEAVFVAGFLAIRNTGGLAYEWGLLEDLTAP